MTGTFPEALRDYLGDFVTFDKFVRLEPLELDLRVGVLVLPLVLLPLLVLLEHLLLEVGLESAVPKGDQCLAVEVGHHLEDCMVVSPVRVVKAVLKLLDECAVRIQSVKVEVE